MNKKQMKDMMDQYEIKTTSKQVLEAYEAKQEEQRKPVTPWWKWGSFAVAGCALACAIAIAFLPHNGGGQPHNSTVMNQIQDDANNHVAYQLLSGMELSDFFAPSERKVNRKLRQAANSDEFTRIVDVYDKASDMVKSTYLSKQNLQKTVYEGAFEGTYKDTYSYQMVFTGLEEIQFYYDGKIEKEEDETETTINGEIHRGNEIYRVVAETEKEVGESEYEISIYFDELHYVVIEQEAEQNEWEYLYSLYENQKLVYEVEFSNDEGEQTLEIKENLDSFGFQIVHQSSTQEIISYQYLEAEGTMTLTYEENQKIYEENESKQKIVKNFQ